MIVACPHAKFQERRSPFRLDSPPKRILESRLGGLLELDDKFKRLIKELGNAINESLSESDKIADVMGRIRAAGYDLFLVLEVTIGFNKNGEAETPRKARAGSRRKASHEFQLTTEDAEFLRGLRISLDDEGR